MKSYDDMDMYLHDEFEKLDIGIPVSYEDRISRLLDDLPKRKRSRLPGYVLCPALIVIICISVYFPAKHILGKGDFMAQWGNILSSINGGGKKTTHDNKTNTYRITVKGICSKRVVSGDDVYEAGRDILITGQEIQIAEAFYLLQGQSEKEAEKAAVKEMEEYNAMYVKAINNGFDVTEDEVDEYISEFKKTAAQAANSDDVKKVMEQFGSEEEYWEYQKIVCEKQLAIQKYIQTLEQKDVDNIREQAVKEQDYRPVVSKDDIDKKFEVR